MNNDENMPEPEPNRCPDCGGLRSIYADDCRCRITLARETGKYQHALARCAMNDPKLISMTVSAAALAVVAVIAWPGEAVVALGILVLGMMAFAGRGE